MHPPTYAVHHTHHRLSPLAAGQWPVLLQTHATLRLWLDPLLLPLRAALAVPVSVVYRLSVEAMQARLPMLERQPTLARCLTIAAAYVLGNSLAVGGLTAAAVWLVGRLTGVRAFV